jgi:hypothetical protein
MRRRFHPLSLVGPENPYPGSDGITTWKASAGSPPWARGSVSGPMMSRNSTMEPGHPWVMISGVASGSGERMCRKWMCCPSMVVVNCGTALILASYSRQS